MPLNRKYCCGCIPPVPLLVYGEDTGLCEVCKYVYDERLYAMRLRQHWNNPDNPLPEGAEDLDTMLRAVSAEYRAIVEA